jgi:hypothetical protein
MKAMILVKVDDGIEAIQPSSVERIAPLRSGKACVVYFSGSSNYVTVQESLEDVVQRINGALHCQEKWLATVLANIGK